MRRLSKYHISGDFIVLEIGVQKGFAIRCMRPAAYLFLRSPKCDHHYDVPVSVLDVSLTRPSVTVGIRILSAKTKALDEAEKNVLVRGPYRGGMIGRKFRNRNGRILILCSGAGRMSRNFRVQSAQCLIRGHAGRKRCTVRKGNGAPLFPSAGIFTDGPDRRSEESEVCQRRKYCLPGF